MNAKIKKSPPGLLLAAPALLCGFLAFALGASDIDAREMRESEVRAAAETWVRTTTRDARPDAAIERMEPYVVGGELVAYVAHLRGEGYCLCAADELLLPVYFYAPRGTFDPANPPLQCLLADMAERARMVRGWIRDNDPVLLGMQDVVSERAAAWTSLMGGRALPKTRESLETTALPTMVALDLGCTWHQGSPYNDQCPTLPPGSDERCVTGCPATAMVQIMHYWKWPNSATGSRGIYYRYRWKPDGSWLSTPLAADPQITDTLNWSWAGRLRYRFVLGAGYRLEMSGYWDWSIKAMAEDTSGTYVHNHTPAYRAALDLLYDLMPRDSTYHYANFGTATYNWDLIEGDHSDPVDPGDTETAKLNYHGGIAVNSIYGLRGTGSSCPEISTNIPLYFRYDPDAVTYGTSIDGMTAEIAWLRPLSIGGCGHAWVIHGYDMSTDPDRLFLMNFGWGGGSDGWYVADTRCPTTGMEHAVRIAPAGVVKFVGSTVVGDGSPSSPYLNVESALLSAPNGATLIFKAGSDNMYSAATLTIDRPLTLKGNNVIIRKGL